MTLRARLVGLALLLGSIAQSHPGHGDPIPENEAVRLASAQIELLVESQKLDESWKLNSRFEKVEVRETEESAEYVVAFTNPTETNAARSTLYVILSRTGVYVAATFAAP